MWSFYSYIRQFLFKLDPEVAHQFALKLLTLTPTLLLPKNLPSIPVKAFGLTFNHPVGLAAGFDKNGQYLSTLEKLGFSFIEIGTITPKAQSGNPKPRLFRIPEEMALINRMGFNNQGVDAVVSHLQKTRYSGLLGINIGKNKDTPLEKADEDYLYCMEKLYLFASYLTINISSPNTPQLRLLHDAQFFSDLMEKICRKREYLAKKNHRWVPILIKISPDESEKNLIALGTTVGTLGIEGIIASNTTVERPLVFSNPISRETGGLSGWPLNEKSSYCLQLLKQAITSNVVLIAAGGIVDENVAVEKIKKGASLLQLYTGLIYKGPLLIEAILKKLAEKIVS